MTRKVCNTPTWPMLARACAGAALASFLGGCVFGWNDEPAREPPPLPEARYAAPAPGMVWIPGAWHFDGVRYVWVPGRWESPRPTP
jgi:hypothetical protein